MTALPRVRNEKLIGRPELCGYQLALPNRSLDVELMNRLRSLFGCSLVVKQEDSHLPFNSYWCHMIFVEEEYLPRDAAAWFPIRPIALRCLPDAQAPHRRIVGSGFVELDSASERRDQAGRCTTAEREDRHKP